MLTRKTLLPLIFALAAFFLILYICEFRVWSITENMSGAPLVALVVDSGIHDGVQASLRQYKEDVEKSGFSLIMVQTGELSNETKEGVREYLRKLLDQNLIGALLVGDIPEAWYEVESSRFPTDVYYMDLDGAWVDSDGNGIFDKHDGEMQLEIWVGRLKVSTVQGNPITLLNNYFEKNHLYRNGLMAIPWWRALLYMDNQGLMVPHPRANPLSILSHIATEIVSVNDTQTQKTTSEDYKMRIQDEVGYNWLYLMCHGTAANHTFLVSSDYGYQWDGTVHSSDYQTLDPRVFFYHFFVCSAGNYVHPNYLAGSAVFANNYGLLAVASTHNAYTFPFEGFYETLSEGKDVGASFLHWIRSAVVERTEDDSVLLSHDDYEILLHDMVIIGDPTLRLYRENHDVALTDLAGFSRNSSGVELLVIAFTVENTGDFTETFNVTVLVDSNVVYHRELALAPGKKEAIVFDLEDSARYLWSRTLEHRIRGRASVVHGEFDVSDNFRYTVFYGNVLARTLPKQLPDAVFAIIGLLILIAISLGFLRLLVSERPFRALQRLIAKLSPHVKGAASKQAGKED